MVKNFIVEIIRNGKGFTQAFVTKQEAENFFYGELNKGVDGTYILKNRDKQLLKFEIKEHNAEENEGFRPYLKFDDKFLGYVREETNLVDMNGTLLKVGDMVLVLPGELLGNEIMGVSFVVQDEEEKYVMGVKRVNIDSELFELAKRSGVFEEEPTEENTKIRFFKIANYTEVPNGFIATGVKMVKEEK